MVRIMQESRCSDCDRFRGWMSGETFAFITTIIDQFGRPTEPIVVRGSSR